MQFHNLLITLYARLSKDRSGLSEPQRWLEAWAPAMLSMRLPGLYIEVLVIAVPLEARNWPQGKTGEPPGRSFFSGGLSCVWLAVRQAIRRSHPFPRIPAVPSIGRSEDRAISVKVCR